MLCIAASAGFSPNSVRELLDYARANPGKVSYGTTAVGGTTHLGNSFAAAVNCRPVTATPTRVVDKGNAPEGR